MLVLTRKEGESLVFRLGDEQVRVLISRITRGSVRVGVEAPASVRVLRAELPEATAKPGVTAPPAEAAASDK